MSNNKPCTAIWKDGVPICEFHGERLVDRATVEAKLGKLDQPMTGNFYCPVSGAMFSFSTAAHDAIRDSGIELP
jgi:hypothetical protein